MADRAEQRRRRRPARGRASKRVIRHAHDDGEQDDRIGSPCHPRWRHDPEPLHAWAADGERRGGGPRSDRARGRRGHELAMAAPSRWSPTATAAGGRRDRPRPTPTRTLGGGRRRRGARRAWSCSARPATRDAPARGDVGRIIAGPADGDQRAGRRDHGRRHDWLPRVRRCAAAGWCRRSATSFVRLWLPGMAGPSGLVDRRHPRRHARRARSVLA